MKNKYEKVFLDLNELAILHNWWKFDLDNLFLFEANEDFTQFQTDLQKFTLLAEKVEGLEFTAKVKFMLDKLAEVIIECIPEIIEQDKDIYIIINKNHRRRNYIVFSKKLESKYSCH